MSKTRQYSIWRDVVRRCDDKSRSDWDNYGGAGVTYDPKWRRFEGFWADMKEGYSDSLSIDRINPKGNYTKENCKWSDRETQNKNKSIYATNKTGIDGVYLSFYEKVVRVVANISKNGKKQVKRFSLGRYSMVEALELAKEWRESKKIELEYSKFHGTLK